MYRLTVISFPKFEKHEDLLIRINKLLLNESFCPGFEFSHKLKIAQQFTTGQTRILTESIEIVDFIFNVFGKENIDVFVEPE